MKRSQAIRRGTVPKNNFSSLGRRLVRNGVLLHDGIDLVFYRELLFLKCGLFKLFVVVGICEMGELAQPLFETLMLMYQLPKLVIAL